ncbi:MAG: hypothetical protein AB7E77_06875 [Desulfobulbus sp.]
MSERIDRHLITRETESAVAFLDVARDALEEGDDEKVDRFTFEAMEKMRAVLKHLEGVKVTA